MLTSFFDIKDRTLILRDANAELRDAFFDLATGEIRYLLIRVGSVLHHDDVLVAGHRLSTPTKSDGLWNLNLSNDEIAQAPIFESDGALDRLALEGWPPILQGPFGNTTSPLLGYGMLRSISPAAPQPTGDDLSTGHRSVVALEQASFWRGRSVFGWDGELGRVADLHFEPATRTMRQLTFENSVGLFELPLECVRHVAEGSDHIVANARKADWSAMAQVESA